MSYEQADQIKNFNIIFFCFMNNKIHIREALINLETWFMDHICQIYLDKSNRKIEPEGTGFLLDFLGMKLLLTAGHIIMDGKIQEIVIPKKNSEGTFSLSGVWYPSDMNYNVGKDPDDYAYLIMRENAYLDFINSGYKFISLKNISFHHIPGPKNIYTLVGFKWRKTKFVGYDKFAKVEVITNFGAALHAYNEFDSIGNRIIVQNQRKFISRNNKQETMGKLDGMSGGAIWSTNLDHDYNTECPTIELVGVLTEYDSQFIYGTNIGKLLGKLVERNHGKIKEL